MLKPLLAGLLFVFPGSLRAADSLTVFKPGDTARASAVNANFKVLWERLDAMVAENRKQDKKIDSLERAGIQGPKLDSLHAKLASMNTQLQGVSSQAQGASSQFQALKTRVDSASLRLGGLSAEFARFGKASQLPVGTIVPSVLPPNKFEGFFDTLTWKLADGARTESKEYLAAFGTDRLPDLRGVFLRGMNLLRADSLSDPDGSRTAGSGQGDATRYPRAGLKVSSEGAHAHEINFETTASRLYSATGPEVVTKAAKNTVAAPALEGAAFPETQAAGAHSHALSGGDAETRPKNVAVYHYIKVR